MKKSILYLFVLLLVIACNTEEALENIVNQPPNDFEVTISEITSSSATINWTATGDPDNEVVTFSIFLDLSIIASDISDSNYMLKELQPSSEYNIKVVAKDASGNEKVVEKTFNTYAISCIPNDLEDNILAFYSFSEGSIDDFVNANHLTNNSYAQPTTDRANRSNCAFSFVADSSDYLTTTNTAFLNDLSAFSISLWFYRTNTTNLGEYNVLVSRDEGLACPDTYGQWSLGLYDLARPVFGHLNSVWDITWDLDKDIDNWNHLVATYNKTNNSLKLYRNGNLANSKTGIASCVSSNEDTGDLIIGRYFDGKLDDIFLFNKELSQEEVTMLFNQEPCCL